MLDINRHRVVRDQPLQSHREHGERVVQAQRSAQVLAQFEERLRFLPRGRDGGKKVAGVAPTGCGAVSASAKPAAGANPRSTLTSVDSLARASHRLRARPASRVLRSAAARTSTTCGSKLLPASATTLLPWLHPAVGLGGTGDPKPARRDNPRLRGFALRSVCPRPSILSDSRCHPTSRDARER